MTRAGYLLGLLLVVVATAASVAQAGAPVTQRISLTSYGGSPNGASWTASISADARFVAFYSGAGNLTPGDGNGLHDVFVRDRLFGTIELVSRSSLGVPGNNHSLYPDISDDGRHIAFASAADNLVPGDTNQFMDVFLKDLGTGETRLVSAPQVGAQANEKSTWCAVSADGRFVAFQSEATNMAPGYDWPGIYLRDWETPSASVVSVSTGGEYGDETSVKPNISADGRYVVFRSWATNLVADDTNAFCDVFLRDVEAGTTERVSVADVSGAEGNGETIGRPAVTPDGRYVVFASYASSLVAGDTNDRCDIFLRDRTLGRTELISVSTAETQGNEDSGGESLMASITPDARYVVFASRASNLVASDTNAAWDVFVRDRQAGTTTLVSLSTAGEQGNMSSGLYSAAIADDGRTVAFDSSADNLVLLDNNIGPDVFARGPALSPQDPILVINDEADYTTSANVTLTIDPGDYSELHFRDDTGDWTAWEPALVTKPWGLPGGDGLKRVWIQGRNGPDLSAENYAEITLDTQAPTSVSIIIEGGAATTITRWVTLTLTTGDAAQMRFRNETSAWSAWLDVAPTREWKLSYDRETKTVAFQVRDLAGNTSTTVNDTIELICFTDVPMDYWAFAKIMACVDAELVAGYPEGDYKPSLDVTRGQMAVYIARAVAGGESEVPAGPTEPSFPDVPTDYWAYDHIEYAYAQNIVRGYEGGDYQPEVVVDRGQMAVYIARSIVSPTGEDGLAGYTPPATPSFPDVATDYWSYLHIEYIFGQDVVQGYDDGLYHPDWAVKRDQMAVYIAKAFQLPLD